MCVTGIHYYEDDNWISHIPYGFLSISQGKLERLRHQEDIEDGIYRQRASSDPALSPRELRLATMIAQHRVLKRINSNPVLSTDSLLSSHSSVVAHDNKAFIISDEGNVLHGNVKVIYQRSVKSESSKSKISRDSKQLDSGFESEQVYKSKIRPHSMAKARDIVSMMGYEEFEQSNIFKKNRWMPSTWRYKHGRKHERRKFLKARKLNQWKEKGVEFLSRGKRWARHVLEGGSHSDNESICSSQSCESDIEMQSISGRTRHRRHKKKRRHESGDDLSPQIQRQSSTETNVDLENAYIDPSLIVSAPRPAILRPENEYSSPSKALPSSIRDDGREDYTEAYVHGQEVNGQCNNQHPIQNAIPSTSAGDVSHIELLPVPIGELRTPSSVSTVVEESDITDVASQISESLSSRPGHDPESTLEYDTMVGADSASHPLTSSGGNTLTSNGGNTNYLTLLNVVGENERECQACNIHHVAVWEHDPSQKVRSSILCLVTGGENRTSSKK